MNREDLIPTHWKSDILKSLKPGLVDKWKNYAIFLCKNRDLKAYLAYRQNNICPWCGNNLYKDGNNYPVIHHISYTNLCTGNITNSFYNGEIISIPDCLNCERLLECADDLVIVHTKCNEEINNCQKNTLKSSEQVKDVGTNNESYESFKIWLKSFEEKYKEDFPQDIVSIANYLAVIFYEYEHRNTLNDNQRLKQNYFNNELLWRVYSGVWFNYENIKQYLIKHKVIKEERALPLVNVLDKISVKQSDYEFSKQCIMNFYDLVLYPKEKEEKLKKEAEEKESINNKFTESIKKWQDIFNKNSYEDLYHMIIEEDYNFTEYGKYHVDRNSLCLVIEKEHPDFFSYCLDCFPKGIGNSNLYIRRLNQLVSFGLANKNRKVGFWDILEDKDLFYRYLELGYCKMFTKKSTVVSFYKISDLDMAIKDGYALSKTMIRLLSEEEKQGIIEKYPIFEKLFVL